MKRCLRFCFKIDKAAGLVVDENGNNEEAFICLKARGVKNYSVDKITYKDLQGSFLKMAAMTSGIDKKLITPITLNEYLDNTEEDDDE